MERCVGILKARFPILKSMALYTLQTQLLIVVATVTVHNYIRQKTERDWLFQKYGNDELIIINSDDEDEEDETLMGSMPSHLTSEMDTFYDNFASLV